MTFLAPGFFLGSLAVAAAIAALHFIVTRQPRAGILPTARFVPDLPATATARATRPSDLLLMLLRMMLVLAAGAGLAKPVLKPSRGADARVILADRSRSVSDPVALRDSVRGLRREGDIMIPFDSSAHILEGGSADSIAVLAPSSARGSLSAALVASLRAGSMLRERADSIELIVVSPLSAEEVDAATDSIRRMWPGRARIVNAGRATTTEPQTEAPGSISLRASPGDPIAVTVGRIRPQARTTLVRNGLTPDSAGVVVDWPLSLRPRGAVERQGRDTVGGVLAGEALVVAAFARRWAYPADSIRGGEVVARWIDGEPAAVEWKSAETCVRSVSVPVSAVGDLVIRNDFARFTEVLTGSCIGAAASPMMEQQQVARLAGNGGLAPRAAFRPRGDTRSWMAPWLFALALVLAIMELFVRRRTAQARAARTPDTAMASAA